MGPVMTGNANRATGIEIDLPWIHSVVLLNILEERRANTDWNKLAP